jgi:hypothetical protein
MCSRGRGNIISCSPLRWSQHEKYAGDKNTKQIRKEIQREKDEREIDG